MRTEEAVDYLRRAHRNGNLIPFIGAGFSSGAADLPSWQDVLHRGLAIIERLGRAPAKELAAFRATVHAATAPDGTPPALLDALSGLQRLIAQDEEPCYNAETYQVFLDELFAAPSVRSTDLADALRGLAPRVCVTTNYDTLIEDLSIARDRHSVTWVDAPEVGRILRSGAGTIHLHGRYDRPETVILSRRDYDRIVGQDPARTLSDAMFHGGVLLFIGASLDGIADPHLSQILERFAELNDARTLSESPHIALFRGPLDATQRVRLRAYGIVPVSYGNDYADLPGFIDKISSGTSIEVTADVASGLIETATRASSVGEVIESVGAFIRDEVFPGRQIRITYAELSDAALFGQHLEARFVQPANASHNVFNYPLSIAAWALIEGRIISWPDEADVACDLGHVDRLGRLEDVLRLADDGSAAVSPELTRYVELDVVRRKLKEGTLLLRDFFQDWSSVQPVPRYSAFLSVPVPIVQSFGNRERIPERGVFNIDSKDGLPLLDARSAALLRLASDVAAIAYSTTGVARP